ncbi:MAG: glycosyltransferase [Rickettsiales bacterium]|nr:glycosyltransferase [Rickettsiales bacterium]
MVKISVIIPIYNTAQFLPKCLESVCGQTLRDIEIICVNDCSTDNSLDILQEYAKHDKRIKIIDLKENKGAAVARNIGVENAYGEYLGFVDSDDFIDLNFYEKLYDLAKKSNCEVVKGNIKMFCLEENAVIDKKTWIDVNKKVITNKANFYCAFTSAIFELSFIKKNKITFLDKLTHFEDPYFAIKAAIFSQKIEVTDDVCYYYVQNPQSSSNKKPTIDDVNSIKIAVEKILDLLDQHCDDKTHYVIVFNFLLELVLTWCNRIDVDNDITKMAIDILFVLFNRCKFARQCSVYHFLERKNIHNQEMLQRKKNGNIKRIQEMRNNVKSSIGNA